MKKLLVGCLGILGLSVLTFANVAGLTSIYRANGTEFWPGTDTDTNWPAIVGFASLNVMAVSGGLSVLLLIVIGIRAALRTRHHKT